MRFPSLLLLLVSISSASAFIGPQRPGPFAVSTSKLYSEMPKPTTFREAEVYGLRLMQEGKYEQALKAFEQSFKLPGSRTDIIRTKTLSGPSPVGGAAGGTEGKTVYGLDEFEYQAVHYNMACAHSKLGNVEDSVKNLEDAFRYGFDNYATVRTDPDLSSIQNTGEFEQLMMTYDPKNGFQNPFSFFGKK